MGVLGRGMHDSSEFKVYKVEQEIIRNRTTI